MEFSNDGIRDSLTGLMAPERFYESSGRLLSWAGRRGEALSLIAITLEDPSAAHLATISRRVQSELRGGDLLSRLGMTTLVLLLVGDEEAAGHLIFRLKSTLKVPIIFSVHEFQDGESILQALDRLKI